jgi:hypothetical protein
MVCAADLTDARLGRGCISVYFILGLTQYLGIRLHESFDILKANLH